MGTIDMTDQEIACPAIVIKVTDDKTVIHLITGTRLIRWRAGYRRATGTENMTAAELEKVDWAERDRDADEGIIAATIEEILSEDEDCKDVVGALSYRALIEFSKEYGKAWVSSMVELEEEPPEKK